MTGELFHSKKGMSGSLRDQMPTDPLVNLDDSAQSGGLILQPNATPANPSVQTDVRSTGKQIACSLEQVSMRMQISF